MSEFNGSEGRITLKDTAETPADQEVAVTGWSVDPTVAEIDVSNSAGGGYGDAIGGIKTATFTFEYFVQDDENLMEDVDLKAGSVITDVKLYLKGGTGATPTGPHWAFPLALVVGDPMTSAVNDGTKVTVNCRSKGPFTRPAGTVAA